MDITDQPLAFYITWTIYGSHLQGHQIGWNKRGGGLQVAQPLLEAWHQERLNYSVELLNNEDRQTAADAIDEICDFRGWKLWIANPRTNHVHVVVTAIGYSGDTVRDQMKAKCTRKLRAIDARFQDRTVWTRGGDWQCINSEDDLESCILYVRDAQDR